MSFSRKTRRQHRVSGKELFDWARAVYDETGHNATVGAAAKHFRCSLKYIRQTVEDTDHHSLGYENAYFGIAVAIQTSNGVGMLPQNLQLIEAYVIE